MQRYNKDKQEQEWGMDMNVNGRIKLHTSENVGLVHVLRVQVVSSFVVTSHCRFVPSFRAFDGSTRQFRPKLLFVSPQRNGLYDLHFLYHAKYIQKKNVMLCYS
jgi:hypothetical protein